MSKISFLFDSRIIDFPKQDQLNKSPNLKKREKKKNATKKKQTAANSVINFMVSCATNTPAF